MVLEQAHLIGVVLVFLCITGAGLYAARKIKSAQDFSTAGHKAGSSVVAGTLMGTMVGGASTIGTAQVAFSWGLSAWWFCLGAGIGFLLLASDLGGWLYRSGLDTLPQVLARSYGRQISPVVTVFTSLGIYFSFMANTLAFVALCGSTLHLTPMRAAVLGTTLTLIYVLFGGVWGTGIGGILKVVLVYLALLACGAVAYFKLGGASGLIAAFPTHPWFSLFGRGFSTDFAAGFSTLLGVFSTQTYFQAIASAKSVKAARHGALVSAIVTPLIGLGAVLVGLYMRSAFPATPSSEVLPTFVLKFFPPIIAGGALASLLVAVVGCSAGLALGISTMFTVDIYKRHLRARAAESEVLLVQRGSLLLTCLIVLLFVNGNAGSLILDWTFLSMGMRGCTVFFPLLGALFFPRMVTPKAGLASALAGPLANFLWHLWVPKGVDPLYPGLTVSLVALVVVSAFSKRKSAERVRSATAG
jgi:SSS family solute:Na+ symporter